MNVVREFYSPVVGIGFNHDKLIYAMIASEEPELVGEEILDSQALAEIEARQ